MRPPGVQRVAPVWTANNAAATIASFTCLSAKWNYSLSLRPCKSDYANQRNNFEPGRANQIGEGVSFCGPFVVCWAGKWRNEPGGVVRKTAWPDLAELIPAAATAQISVRASFSRPAGACGRQRAARRRLAVGRMPCAGRGLVARVLTTVATR